LRASERERAPAREGPHRRPSARLYARLRAASAAQNPRPRPSPLTQLTYASGDAILTARERGELFCIVKEGAAAPRAPGGALKGGGGGGAAAAAAAAPARLGPGEFFGERALLAGAAAATTGAAAAAGQEWDYFADAPRTVVLAMRRGEFERLLGPYEELWRWVGEKRGMGTGSPACLVFPPFARPHPPRTAPRRAPERPRPKAPSAPSLDAPPLKTSRYEVLRRVPILFPLADRQLWQLARALVPGAFAKGEAVFRAGEEATTFYIVQGGAFTCFTGARVRARAAPAPAPAGVRGGLA
jgi:CRP-like cAMP-binding protein